MKINTKNCDKKGSQCDPIANEYLKIRIAVLGLHDVGKSAFTVRYLTKRYIGEYKSTTDMLYQQTIKMGQTSIDIEVVDISTSASSNESKTRVIPVDEFQRVDGFIIVYSITDRSSFIFAQEALETIANQWNPNLVSKVSTSTSSSGSSGQSAVETSPTHPTATCPILLVANKKDLGHLRVVEKAEGLNTSVQYGCHFHELSVAENSPEIYTSFQNLISAFVTQNKEPSKRKFSISKLLKSLRFGRASLPHHVVTSQASVVDTDISFSFESSESTQTTLDSSTSLGDNLCNDSCSCHLKSKTDEINSMKNLNNSSPIHSL